MHYLLAGTLILAILMQACGPAQNSSPQEAWDSTNHPRLMAGKPSTAKQAYSSRWNDLPLKGKLSQVPWTDDYWPTYRGGLTYRWNDWSVDTEEPLYNYQFKKTEQLSTDDTASLSPLEKFDLFLGHDSYPHSTQERERTKIMKLVPGSELYDSEYFIPKWEGLCHAWAPATLLFDEPEAVTIENAKGLAIQFGSSDVKALLTYFLHQVDSPETVVLGERCRADFASLQEDVDSGVMSKKEFQEMKDAPACADTNAGSFHLVLSNQIGRLNEGFVVDVTRDQEVWNQPVFAYESRILKQSKKASPGAAPGTVREIEIETSMSFVQEVTQHWYAGDHEEALPLKTYQYVVELDKQERIIGGRWLSEERPDFMWKQSAPAFTGDYKAVEKIYQASLKAKREAAAASPSSSK